jgi:hypothetical protein
MSQMIEPDEYNEYKGIAYYSFVEPSKTLSQQSLPNLQIISTSSGIDQLQYFWFEFTVRSSNLISVLRWLESLGHFEGVASLQVNETNWIQLIDIPGTHIRRLKNQSRML